MRKAYPLIPLACLALLLGYGGSERGEKPPARQDNSLCLVCHLDFEAEPLSTDHLAQGITCVRCHGRSEHHMSDETLMTKPDILFGRAEVEPFCYKCHQKHKNPAAVEEFLQQWRGKIRPNGRTVRQDSICTDCHGRHLILRRKEKPGSPKS